MRGFRQFALLAALSAALVCAQNRSMSAPQVIALVRASAKSSPDKDVADRLRKITMIDRLTDNDIAACIQAGAGPRTRAALIDLARDSAPLAETRRIPPPLPPLSEDQEREVLDKVTEYAVNYAKNLPNFTCIQVTRKYRDPSNTGNYQLDLRVVERLSHLDHQEQYKVLTVNNEAMPDADHWKLGGTTSAGEFGTDMRALFDPRTQTEFEWDSWTTWHGRRTHKFRYRVSQPNSGWEIRYGDDKSSERKTIAGYKGLIYVDRDSNMIMRIDREAEGLAPDFPIQNVKQTTTYDFQKIGEAEQEYLVPKSSVITSKSGRVMVKNETEFRLYNKYGTIIKFIPEGPDEVTPAPPAKKQD